MTWSLRRATVADLDAIMAIETTTFTSDAWSRRGMKGELGSSHTLYLVATRPESPEVVDGYAGLFASAGAVQADIQTIAVASHARRQGLGRMLMQTMLAEARARGAREVFLEVRADNPSAQSLYASLGFDQISVRRGYYQPDGVDALVMRAEVRPTPFLEDAHASTPAREDDAPSTGGSDS